MVNKELEMNGYIITFDYKENKCKVRRKDNVTIDMKSKEFLRDLNDIKRTKEYAENYRLMNLYNINKTKSSLSENTSDRLLEFTKSLLHE
ncbi:hypothetical protein NNC19_02750 [Clostridium sp. SHJSY1]|uniref:hypothetical protein n=1 Tax=Clostridium sp. SHJSY1 TaxID=2942483 RepID=UPI0028759EE4|nr:hypothetical protein [Clostridium sp. SHJSY1]MDS0524581.1 hypothetical protein [Clostridium sp. SHJSY1]